MPSAAFDAAGVLLQESVAITRFFTSRMRRDLSAALEIVTRTDPGKVRSHNEDAVLGNAALGLAVLADGMGGYNAGEVASRMATALLGGELNRAFSQRSPDHRDDQGRLWAHVALATEIARANAAIRQTAESQAQYAGMGTTVVVALFHDNKVTVAHVGDSRLYRLRGAELRQLTRDHSLLQEQIDSGIISPGQARYSQNRNLVTRALGVDPVVEAEVGDHEVQAGDLYLLCSDGLNDMVEDEQISLTLATLSANLQACAGQLIAVANDQGGRDNVSVVLVKVKRAFPARSGWWGRLLGWFR